MVVEYFPLDGPSAGLSVLGTYLVRTQQGGDARRACTCLKTMLIGAL